MPHVHLSLLNNQSISQNLSKASLVTVEAPNYPNAPTRTSSQNFRVGFS